MAGKKSALIAAIANSISACEKAIANIEPELSGIPHIPRYGGQGYYEARIKYVEAKIVPHFDIIELAVDSLETNIAALEAYAKKNAKKFFKKDAAKKAEAYLKLARPTPDLIKTALSKALGFWKSSVADDRKVYNQLKKLGVDFG